MPARLSVHISEWPQKRPFQINGRVFTSCKTVEVQISDGSHIGRGEAVGVFYMQETAASLLAQIEAVRSDIEAGTDRVRLQALLPPGGARNAIDCALWDLEAKVSGRSIWELVEIMGAAQTTFFTIGIEASPKRMAAAAKTASQFSDLKIKLDNSTHCEALTAIRQARPDSTLIVDANQAFNFSQLCELMPKFEALGIALIEQPLPRGEDSELVAGQFPIPICADESCLSLVDLNDVLARYDAINIKLDKSGGLTEALEIAHLARGAGKRLMVGNMMGTSLSIAPSFVVAQLCDFVDLDGPLCLQSDHLGGMTYAASQIGPSSSNFWANMPAISHPSDGPSLV